MNNAVKLLPLPAWGYCARLEQGTGVDNWFLHWPLKRGSSHTYYSALFCSQEQAEQLAAAINTTTPREQELEAQNKALWELVEHCGVALTWFNANTAEKNRWISGEALAAIQKAKEKR
jgi:hypothetical protein